MGRIKVAIVHNVMAPYRHPLFEKLSEILDLTVYYCSVKSGLRKWDMWPRNYNYKYRTLFRIPIKVLSIELSVNPSIAKELVLNRPHVLIVCGYIDPTMWLAYAVGKLLKIPIIHTTEGIKEPRSLLGVLTRPLRTIFLKKSSAIVVHGALSKRYVISLGARPEKIFIAPNCIDNDFFVQHSSKYKKNKEGLKKELKVNKEKVILYVGQLIERKGVSYLIRAYERFKQEDEEIALIIIGSGPLRNQLSHMCNVKSISDVHFIESGLKLADLIKYYSIADVFVLPTLFDVWGFVINEAMACGLPVISTKNAQAAVEMIRYGENGIVVKEADEEDLYSAMKNLLSSEEPKFMGRKSLEIVTTKFDPDLMKERFIEAINYTLCNYRKPLQGSAVSS